MLFIVNDLLCYINENVFGMGANISIFNSYRMDR
jgi:hypothetical protein